MRFFKIRIKNIEGVILVERKTERGYRGSAGHIQSSTLRGAFITSLYLNGYIQKDVLNEFRNNSDIMLSNAYPIKDGMESFPAHPFMYECKIDGEKINYLDGVIKQLRGGKEVEYRIECSRRHIALNYVHPRPVIPKKDSTAMFDNVSLYTELKVSAGISKHRATVQKGMIYEYEMLIGGQEFWAYLGISDKLSNYINKGLEIRVGRGVTRGHGLCKIINVKEIKIDEISDKIDDILKEEMIFYALTPLLGPVSDTQYFSYPTEIDLNKMMDVYGSKLGEYGKICVKKAYGKTRDFSCGWDMIKNAKRSSLKDIASEGSIIVTKLNTSKYTKDALAVLSLIGFPVKSEDFIIQGINIMMPIEICPIGGG